MGLDAGALTFRIVMTNVTEYHCESSSKQNFSIECCLSNVVVVFIHKPAWSQSLTEQFQMLEQRTLDT